MNNKDEGEMPLVSVVMNCLNVEKYLKEAIDSVYAQQYKNWEIIFWDNASTDRSSEIALSYDERLRYFRGSETIPLGAARNRAIEQARGEFVAFLDCDDLWLEDKLMKQVSIMTSGRHALCYGGAIIIDSDGESIRTTLPKYKSGNIFGKLLKRYEINMQTVIIRRSILEEDGYRFDTNLFYLPDFILFMDIAYRHEIAVISVPIVKYRVHQDCLSYKIIDKWSSESEVALDTLTKKYPSIPGRFEKELEYAYGLVRYYRARYYISKGDKKAARKELRSNFGLDTRYWGLYLLLFMPRTVWDFAHKVTGKY